MELNTFLNVRDTLQKTLIKKAFKLKIIDKKIYTLKGKDLTIVFFYRPQRKYMKIYYIDSFNLWTYRISFYHSDIENRTLNSIKKYIKEIEDKKYGLY